MTLIFQILTRLNYSMALSVSRPTFHTVEPLQINYLRRLVDKAFSRSTKTASSVSRKPSEINSGYYGNS